MEMMSCDEYFMVGKCEGQRLVDGETIQLVRQPSAEGKNGIPSLLEAIGRNRDWFEEMIIKNSAVLLRGFDVKDGVEFNDVVEALAWDEIRYVGVSHRKQVHKRAWTANEGDLSEFIHYHHEMLSMKIFPKKAIFFCEAAPPEGGGGETPFIPSFCVAERMLEEFPEFVEEADKKGLAYTFKSLGKCGAQANASETSNRAEEVEKMYDGRWDKDS